MAFSGFDTPKQNWFKLPTAWVNITAGINSLAEVKVIQYVLRHTWGFQEYGIPKKITTDEFMRGRMGKDRRRMDDGTGLSKQSVIDGLRKAVEDGYLVEQVDDRDKGRIKKSYMLRMRRADEPDADVKNLDIRVKKLDSKSLESGHRTEKETLERYFKKDTVNNGQIKDLPDLDQPKEKKEYMARLIRDQLGDEHSSAFYRLVASKIPEELIYQTLSEIKTDGARNPARVFTYRMTLYAREMTA